MNERARVLALVYQHGRNATAFQVLESGYSYFFDRDDACIAYVDTGSAWVAAGAPLAAPDRSAEVSAAFLGAARASGKRCCFFATEGEFRTAAGAAWRSVRIGEQPEWDPREWRATLARRRSLREQLRRARAKGVRVRMATPDELRGHLGNAAVQVAERWLDGKALAQMVFLVRLQPFTFLSHRKCFVAEMDGRLVAFAAVIPVPARHGWFLEDLVRDPDAPNGTTELLVDAVMTWASVEGCDWLTLGLAPLAGNVNGVLRLLRVTTRWLYDFDGVRAFKAKLQPKNWSPIHLTYPATQSLFASHLDALSAFAGGGLVSFGLRTALGRRRRHERTRATKSVAYDGAGARYEPCPRTHSRGHPIARDCKTGTRCLTFGTHRHQDERGCGEVRRRI